MTIGIIFYLLFFLLIKHLMIDFPVYTGYVCRNTESASMIWFGHIAAHGIVTFIIFMLVGLPLWICLTVALIDLITHWIFDSCVAYCNRRSAEDEEFKTKYYWLSDLDQFLHNLVYVGIVALAIFLL